MYIYIHIHIHNCLHIHVTTYIHIHTLTHTFRHEDWKQMAKLADWLELEYNPRNA